MSAHRAAHACAADAGSAFNVLWPGGELAARSVRGMVMEAVGMLRRLGVDVRIRMPDARSAAGPADSGSGHWADTVLVVDDATRSPAALLADLGAAAQEPDVLVLAMGALTPPAGPAPDWRGHMTRGIRVLVSPDAASLASAWLSLAATGSAARDEVSAPASPGEERPSQPFSARF